jgi:hypothetical protein
MISPEDIKQQALKWWKPFLQSYILKEPFFPKENERIGKAKPGELTGRFEALQNEITSLYSKSKNETGIGYLVKTAEKNFRRTGTHQLPHSIIFETADDFLHVTKKTKEWELFVKNYEQIINSLPQLKNWIYDNPLSLTLPGSDWNGILLVCKYFISAPRPELYLRQLPITVHTKFIEENETLIQSLLDFLIPEHIRDKNQKKFVDRYFLQKDEVLIRIRILDEDLAIANNIKDLSIRLSDFEKSIWHSSHVFITENKMNFLTLPPFPSAIAIWSGGGFKVSYLKNAHWLAEKNIYYWGDIDEHGFLILHQLRTYYKQAKSVMMDRLTFDKFQGFAVTGERNNADKLQLLNEEEANLYAFLKSRQNNRLEQEKISQDYVEAVFSDLRMDLSASFQRSF